MQPDTREKIREALAWIAAGRSYVDYTGKKINIPHVDQDVQERAREALALLDASEEARENPSTPAEKVEIRVRQYAPHSPRTSDLSGEHTLPPFPACIGRLSATPQQPVPAIAEAREDGVTEADRAAADEIMEEYEGAENMGSGEEVAEIIARHRLAALRQPAPSLDAGSPSLVDRLRAYPATYGMGDAHARRRWTPQKGPNHDPGRAAQIDAALSQLSTATGTLSAVADPVNSGADVAAAPNGEEGL